MFLDRGISTMSKDRLLSFTDGCVTIFLTIMVLNFATPEGNSLWDLQELIPTFITYILSFMVIAISWGNHHHMFATVKNINGAIIWTNLLWIFVLSQVTFASDWMGSSGFAAGPVAFYGFILVCCNLSFFFIQSTIIKEQKKMNDCGDSCSILAVALGTRWKEKITLSCYVMGTVLSFLFPPLVGFSLFLYAGATAFWFVPDKRIENIL